MPLSPLASQQRLFDAVPSSRPPQRRGAERQQAHRSAIQALYRIVKPPPPTHVVPDFAPHVPTWAMARSEGGLTAQDHQATGSTWLIEQPRGFLCDDMGMGKSKQVIDAIDYLAKKALPTRPLPVLLVCEGGSIDSWLDEIETNAPHIPVYAFRGAKRTWAQLHTFAGRPGVRFVIVSYNNFRTAYQEFSQTMIPWWWSVLDEGQAIKGYPLNGKPSQISRLIHVVKPERRHIISGTPILNTLAELWNQLRWLGVWKMSWDEFEAAYCKVLETTYGKKIVGYMPDGIAEVKRAMYSNYIRRDKSRKLGLPPCVIAPPIKVPMYANEAARYVEAVKDSNLHTLMQLTSGAKSKLDWAEQKVQEALGNGQKVVIFTKSRTTLRLLEERFAQYGALVINGDVSTVPDRTGRSPRQQVVYKFSSDPKSRILLATCGAARYSLNFTAASIAIFMDKPWSPEIFKQNLKRLDRLGQQRMVNVYTLFSVIQDGRKRKMTIDGQIERAVKNKSKLIDPLMEGRATPEQVALFDGE